MLTKTLAAAAALSMLVGGGAALAAQPKSTMSASPKQPIPYSELDAYLKATPKTRASKDWWSGASSASTGMSTDTSATAPMASMSAMPPATTTPDTSVNPPSSAAPTSMPSTPPTNAPAQPDMSSTTPAQPK